MAKHRRSDAGERSSTGAQMATNHRRWWSHLIMVATMVLCASNTFVHAETVTSPVESNARVLHYDDRPLIDYTVTSYGPREGAPSGVFGITQTPDGFLWLATTQGLVRFDGDHFSADERVHGFVSTVVSDASGAVWAGFQFGGIARLTPDHYENLSRGLPHRTVFGIVFDGHGRAWAQTTAGLYKLEGTTWLPTGPDDGLPKDAEIRRIGKLADGTIWVLGGQSQHQGWVRGAADTSFQPLSESDLWWKIFGVRPENTSPESREILEHYSFGSQSSSFVRDPSGHIWHTGPTFGRLGLSGEGASRALMVEALPGNWHLEEGGTSVMIDREGNIWLGEVDGIDKVSVNRLHALAPRKVMYAPAIARGPLGDVWIAPFEGNGIFHAIGGKIVNWRTKYENITELLVDHGNALWIFNFDTFALPRLTGDIEHVGPDGAVTHIGYPKGFNRPPVAFVENPSGGYLMSSSAGFYRYEGGDWLPGIGRHDLPNTPALRLAPDASGKVWLGYPSGDVAVMDASKATVFPAKDVALGPIFAISPGTSRTWLAGDNGIAFIENGRIKAPLAGMNNPFVSARGIIQTSNGELWISAARGVYRIDKAGVELLLAGSPPAPGSMELFTEEDGLQGSITDVSPGPSLVEGGDGKIWMQRLDGASWLDPKDVLRNTIPAQAFIDSVVVDGQTSRAEKNLSIAPGVHSLRINFTSPSLTRPDRVTFRYRISGVDKAWQEVSSSRFADYSDPPPGTYVFEVMAFNEDRLSTGVPARIQLVIQPTVFQTWWFRSLCVLLALGLLLLFYAVRLHAGREKLRLRLEAKHEERDRIARELHDTLMQSMQGLALQVHAWSEGDAAALGQQQIAMRRAADAANAAVRDGRDKILELRVSHVPGMGLLDVLRHTIEELALTSMAAFDLAETGLTSRLSDAAFEDIVEVAREGIRNAVLHANAKIITVRIHHGLGALTLTIWDDGSGLPPQVAEAGYIEGHWGLVGMRERAKRLRARLSLTNRQEGGAELRLVIPGRAAYEDSLSRWVALVRKLFVR